MTPTTRASEFSSNVVTMQQEAGNSPNLAHASERPHSVIWCGFWVWVWQEGSTAPPTNFQRCSPCGTFRWAVWNSVEIRIVSLKKKYCDSIDLNLFFCHLQGLYFNELLCGGYSHPPQTLQDRTNEKFPLPLPQRRIVWHETGSCCNLRVHCLTCPKFHVFDKSHSHWATY